MMCPLIPMFMTKSLTFPWQLSDKLSFTSKRELRPNTYLTLILLLCTWGNGRDFIFRIYTFASGLTGEQFLFQLGLIESWEASRGSLWSPPVLPILWCPQTPKLPLKINAKLVIYWYLALFSNENITFSNSLNQSIIIKKMTVKPLGVQYDILIYIHWSVQVEIIRGSANHKVILCLCFISYAWVNKFSYNLCIKSQNVLKY